MSTVTSELTNTSGTNSGSIIDTSGESLVGIIDTDKEDTDDVNEKRLKRDNTIVCDVILISIPLRSPNKRKPLKNFCHEYCSILKLVIKSTIPDIKSFKLWQIILLLLFATFNVIFSILDFNSFFQQRQRQRSIFKWMNDLNDRVPLWRRILLCFSGIASFTNVVNVVLVIKGKLSSYLWGIIAAILYGIYSFAYGYIGDAQLYFIFFLPMQFIGIYMWSKELDSSSTTRVRSLSPIPWLVVLIISIGLAVLFYYEIPAFSNLLTLPYYHQTVLVPHILDATTNALSVVAQFLLIFCYWEQYVYWLAVNLMAIVMYSGLFQTKLEINVLLVWVMLAINSFIGLYIWFMRWSKLRRIGHISMP
ncbi:unnamed protein product [Didymodactylos carnosus]|uniref:Nicotinamide mononucleotide transporter n=1 Tax=Didymodactylos carnosus TaxID=1234261 RepID=A0A813Q8Y6_9BILA|nr:unnamed protein product [Didymodactylos carnosus]CAF3544803.1 unnamed protein product [Didymodactylos carnosus]